MIDKIKELKLPEKFKADISTIRDKIKEIYPTCSLYLFGSCARQVIHEDSDIDLLILLDYDFVRMDRINLRTAIDEATGYTLEFDLKMYNRDRFKEILENHSVFETTIFSESVNID